MPFWRGEPKHLLDAEDLAAAAKLRRESRLDQAERILLKAEPTQAVLDELRKIASIRAHSASEAGDWSAVVRHLEGYNLLARKRRKRCIELVNGEPPAHTEKDKKLLQNAKSKLGS